MTKNFLIKAADFKQLANDRGSCLSSDRITVDGKPVGFIYREEPDSRHDSGWRFLAGDEDDDYMSDAANFELYDVNTIANYDTDVIPLLDAPAGSAFIRDPVSNELVPDDS